MPEFEIEVFEYTVYVESVEEAKAIELEFAPIDENAVVTRTGATEFSNEDVEVKVTVEGSYDLSNEYTIRIHVLTPFEKMIEDNLYILSAAPDVSQLPSGFNVEETELEGEKIYIAKSKNGELTLVQFVAFDENLVEDFQEEETDKNTSQWYLLDAETGKFVPSNILNLDGKPFVVTTEKGDTVFGEGEEGLGYYSFDKEEATIGEYLGESLEKTLPLWPILVAMFVTIVAAGVVAVLFYKEKILRLVYRFVGTPQVEVTTNYFKAHLYLEDDCEDEERQV